MQSKPEEVLEAVAGGEAPCKAPIDWPWFLIESLMMECASGSKKIYEPEYKVGLAKEYIEQKNSDKLTKTP